MEIGSYPLYYTKKPNFMRSLVYLDLAPPPSTSKSNNVQDKKGNPPLFTHRIFVCEVDQGA